MNIKNETHWRTDDIKRYLVACIKHEGLDPHAPWHITIYYTRRCNNVMGYAYYESRTFRIGLPRRLKKEWTEDTGRTSTGRNWKRADGTCGFVSDPANVPVDAIEVWAAKILKHKEKWEEIDELPIEVRKRVLQVTLHEIGHCKGLRHKDMVNSRTIPTDFFDFEANPIRKQAKHLPRSREAAAGTTLPTPRRSSPQPVARSRRPRRTSSASRPCARSGGRRSGVRSSGRATHEPRQLRRDREDGEDRPGHPAGRCDDRRAPGGDLR